MCYMLFFFKQKTAYEMRISDWSSDVCSSDLSSYCAAFTCAPGTNGLPVTGDIAEIFELGKAGQPSGNTNAWVVPDLDAGTALVDLYGRPAVLQRSQARRGGTVCGCTCRLRWSPSQ